MNQALSQSQGVSTAPWLEAAAFGLMLCDAELTVMHANGRCGEMLALEHLGGRKLFDLLELPDAQRTLALQELESHDVWQGLARSEQRALKVEVRATGTGAVVSLIDYSADLEHLQKLTDAKTMARTLNVAYLIEGSVRRSPETVRVSAQIVDGRTGFARSGTH